MSDTKYKVVTPRISLLKNRYSSDEIKEAYRQLAEGKQVTFYVEIKGSPGYSDRLHLVKESTVAVTIDIDKGSDGGTWSKSFDTDVLDDFFTNIHTYIEQPEANGFTYEQW